jgi:hypothetical protein
MQMAIKPTIADLKKGNARTAIDTLLDYGISPTQRGVEKVRTLIDDLNSQIAGKVANSPARIDKNTVLGYLGDVNKNFANQVSPTSDLSAISGIADDFISHPLATGQTMSVPLAQQLKQGTYKALKGKYGEAGSAATEAQKALARGLKTEIGKAVPEIVPLNAEEARLLKTLGVAERRALMELNKNPVGLSALAQNPYSFAAFMADRSAAFKALAARMVNQVPKAVDAATGAGMSEGKAPSKVASCPSGFGFGGLPGFLFAGVIISTSPLVGNPTSARHELTSAWLFFHRHCAVLDTRPRSAAYRLIWSLS